MHDLNRDAEPASRTAARPSGPERSGLGRVEGLLDLQRAAGNEAVAELVESGRSSVLDVLSSGGGRPLEADVRSDMETRLGADFGDVRVHTGPEAHESARAVQAHAYTVGSDIVFQRDRYDPGSTAGRTMLAHELTHVIQQRSGPVEGTPTGDGISVSDPSDRFEVEAVANAERAMAVQRGSEESMSGAVSGGSARSLAVGRANALQRAPEAEPGGGAVPPPSGHAVDLSAAAALKGFQTFTLNKGNHFVIGNSIVIINNLRDFEKAQRDKIKDLQAPAEDGLGSKLFEIAVDVLCVAFPLEVGAMALEGAVVKTMVKSGEKAAERAAVGAAEKVAEGAAAATEHAAEKTAGLVVGAGKDFAGKLVGVTRAGIEEAKKAEATSSYQLARQQLEYRLDELIHGTQEGYNRALQLCSDGELNKAIGHWLASNPIWASAIERGDYDEDNMARFVLGQLGIFSYLDSYQDSVDGKPKPTWLQDQVPKLIERLTHEFDETLERLKVGLEASEKWNNLPNYKDWRYNVLTAMKPDERADLAKGLGVSEAVMFKYYYLDADELREAARRKRVDEIVLDAAHGAAGGPE